MKTREVPIDNCSEDYTLDRDRYLVECICPKCRTRHHIYLNWMGRGVPRKFCNSCRKFAQNGELDGIFSINLYGRALPSE